jgi:hypothetical protein
MLPAAAPGSDGAGCGVERLAVAAMLRGAKMLDSGLMQNRRFGADGGCQALVILLWRLPTDTFRLSISERAKFMNEVLIGVFSSLIATFILWLISRYRPVADWINNHRISSALAGLLVIYIAGMVFSAYMVFVLRQEMDLRDAALRDEMNKKFASLHQDIYQTDAALRKSLAAWPDDKVNTPVGTMVCPPNT